MRTSVHAENHWLPVDSSTFEVVVIVGMAVGVDYSLFYLRREREERARGRSFPEALRIAARTSGAAIVAHCASRSRRGFAMSVIASKSAMRRARPRMRPT